MFEHFVTQNISFTFHQPNGSRCKLYCQPSARANWMSKVWWNISTSIIEICPLAVTLAAINLIMILAHVCVEEINLTKLKDKWLETHVMPPSSHVCLGNFQKYSECLVRNLEVNIWHPTRLLITHTLSIGKTQLYYRTYLLPAFLKSLTIFQPKIIRR